MREIETDDDGLVRLQKLLAQSGVASRRKCEELMLAGLVEVDGEVVTRLGTKVDPTTAVVRVEGRRLPPVSEHVCLVVNKPLPVRWSRQFLCSTSQKSTARSWRRSCKQKRKPIPPLIRGSNAR